MLSNALNQRYATVEDLFVKFVAPEICGNITPDNDTYFLYSPYKNICPTKAQIEKGITMHYVPYHIHKQFVTDFSEISQLIKTGIGNYFAYSNINYNFSENDTFNDIVNAFSSSNANNIPYSSLRITILDIFNYINVNVIAELKSYENYSYIISTPDFVLDESRYGSASDITLNIGFQKLSDLSTRVSAHIPNINEFTVQNMIDIYTTCVLKENFDIIYTTYKFEGYMVLDNSEAHQSGSLCRLCDISKIGLFDIITSGNNEYDYNAYAAFSTNTSAQIFPTNPYTFQVVSHYISNNYALPFQITNIQVTNVTDNGVDYTNALTQEAINFYKSNTNYKYSDLIDTLPVDIDKIKTLSENSKELDETQGKTPQLSVDPIEGLDKTPILKASSYKPTTMGTIGINRPGVGTIGLNNIDGFSQTTLQTIDTNIVLNNRFTSSSSIAFNRFTETSHEYYKADGSFFNKNIEETKQYLNSDYTKKTWDAAGLNTGRQNNSVSRELLNKHISSIDELKYANSNLLLKNMQVGIVPYIDNEFIPSYLNAKTSINPNKYTNFALCFIEPNKNVNKRSAIVTLTQEKSNISKDIQISQYGAPLIINLRMIKPIALMDYNYTVMGRDANNKITNYKVDKILWRFALKNKPDLDASISVDNPSQGYANDYISYKDNNLYGYKELGAYGGIIDISTQVHKQVLAKKDPKYEGQNTTSVRYLRSSYTNEPIVEFLFQTENRSLENSNANLENQFIIKCDYADWYEMQFKIYYDSYSLSVPDALKRIILNCQIEPIIIHDISPGNYSDISSYIMQSDSSTTTWQAQRPVIAVEYLYDGQNIDSHLYDKLNTIYTSIDSSTSTQASDASLWSNNKSNNFFTAKTNSWNNAINLNIITSAPYNNPTNNKTWYNITKKLDPFQEQNKLFKENPSISLP